MDGNTITPANNIGDEGYNGLEMQRITRRALLAGTGLLVGCGRPRSSGYDGYVFVANQQGGDVAAVDLMTFNVSRRIRLGAAPSVVVGHRQRRAAYVLCGEEGTIREIDATAGRVRRTVRLPGPAAGMRPAPSGDALWALCRHALVEVPLENFRPAARIRLPFPGDDFDLSRDGAAAVTFRRENRIGLAETGDRAIETTIPAGGGPSAVRFRSDGRQVLAGNRAGRTVTVADVRRARVVAHLPVPVEPAVFCYSNDGGQLFVSGPGRDAVSIIYPYSTEVAETILAGRGPESMAASTDPDYLFVANPQSATVTVLSIESRKLVAVAGVGADPGEILFTPDRQYALVLNRGSGDLAVLRIRSLRITADGRTRRYTAPPLFTLIPVGSRPVSAAVVPA